MHFMTAEAVAVERVDDAEEEVQAARDYAEYVAEAGRGARDCRNGHERCATTLGGYCSEERIAAAVRALDDARRALEARA